MNKKLLGILAFFSASFSFSQTFTQANEPVVGETKLLYVCDSFATNYANVTGNGVTWDYNNIPSYPNETKNITVVAPSTTAYASDFTNSTAATHIDNFTFTFLSTTSSSRKSQGFVLENTDLGVVKAVFGADEQDLMNYPMSMPTVVNDAFAGNLYFTYSGIPQSPMLAGQSTANYDGIGTLIQPDGSSLPNISRFHIQDTATTTVPFVGTVNVIRSQYEYYDLSSSAHLPVFLHLSAKVVSAFPDPLIDLTVVLSQVQGPTNLGLEESKMEKMIAYPNPAKDVLTLNAVTSNSKVSLVDISGRAITLVSLGNNNFDLSNVTPGLYILQVENGTLKQTQTLVVQ